MTLDRSNTDQEENIPVTINGVVYDTNLYGGVQRFVPEEDVYELVSLWLRYRILGMFKVP